MGRNDGNTVKLSGSRQKTKPKYFVTDQLSFSLITQYNPRLKEYYRYTSTCSYFAIDHNLVCFEVMKWWIEVKKTCLILQVARENLTSQANELNRMKADYGDVVPRRDFQTLQMNFDQMNDRYETLQKDFAQLRQEHDTLLDVHKQVRLSRLVMTRIESQIFLHST